VIYSKPAVADDLHARAMLARIRSALVGMDTEPVRVGRFEIVRVLGRGGMGVVYEARDPNLDRVVAIKVIDANAEQRSRVLREARALARVQHAADRKAHV
jgi:serine/threonine protein kinase